MTNKKFKIAAMSMALTACVAAQPLIANAADEVDVNSNGANVNESHSEEGSSVSTPVAVASEGSGTESNGSQSNGTGNESNQSDGTNMESTETKEEAFGEHVDINYDRDNPKTDEKTGSTAITGEVVKKNETEDKKNETDDKKDETDDKKDETDDKKDETGGEKKSDELVPPTDGGNTEKNDKDKQIGNATIVETPNSTVTGTPEAKPGAKPVTTTDTTTKDGTTTITETTTIEGTQTTTTTGSGHAKADTEEITKDTTDISTGFLREELGDIDWNVKKDDKVGTDEKNPYKVTSKSEETTGDTTKQTLTLEKVEETKGHMTAEDIAKLVDADRDSVNKQEDGSYTLKRTETVTDADGNPVTRTTYITVRKDTDEVSIKTTTTIKVTREKVEHHESGNKDAFEKDTATGFKLPDIDLYDKDKKKVGRIDEKTLNDLINKDTQPKSDGTKTTYTVTVKEGDVTREYEITKDLASSTLTPKEIAARMGSDYEADGDKVYYVGNNGQRVELTVDQTNVIREKLSYTVKVKETKKDPNGPTIDNEKKAEAEAKAKNEAVRDALTNAVTKMLEEGTITEKEAAELNKKISDGTINAEDGGTFQTEITVDGVTKHFELDYSKGTFTTTPTPNKDKDDDKTTDNTDYTVNGKAYVFGGKVVQDNGGTVENGDNTITFDKDGKVQLPDGATSLGKDEKGRLKGYTIGDTTYEFEYGTMTTDDAKQALGNKLNNAGWELGDFTPDITTVSWTAKTTTVDSNSAADIYDKDCCTIQKDENANTYTITVKGSGTDSTAYTGLQKGDNGTYTGTHDGKSVTITVTEGTDLTSTAIEKLLRQQYTDIPTGGNITITGNTATYTGTDGKKHTVSFSSAKNQTILVQTVEVLSPIYAQPQKTEQAVINDICNQLQVKLDALPVGQTLQVTGKDGKVATIKKTSSGYTLSESDKTEIQNVASVQELAKTIVAGYASNQINYDSLTSQEIWELLDVQQQYADGKNNSYTNGQGCDSYWAAPGYENNGTTNADKTHNGEVPQYGTTTFDSLGLDANVTIEDAKTGKKIDGVLLNDAKHSLTFTYGTKEQIAGYVDLSKYPDYRWDDEAYYGEGGLIGGTKADHHPTTGATTAALTGTVAESKKGDYWNGTSYDQKDKLTYTVNGGSLTGKNFYQVIGSVAYDQQGNDYTDKTAADAALEKLKADNEDGKYDSGVVVTYMDNGIEKYRVYGKVTNLKAYGYMTASANTSTNQKRSRGYSTWTPGNGAYWGQEEAGTYELRIQGLKKYGDTVTGQYGVGKSLDLSVMTENQGSAKHLDVSQTSTTSTTNGSGYYGSYTNTWTKEENWRISDTTSDVEGDGDGLYTSFVRWVSSVFNGGTGNLTREGGTFHYKYDYATVGDLQGEHLTQTVEKHAKVDYDYITEEVRNVKITDQEVTIITPDGGDDDDNGIIDENTPDSPVLPSTPELPPVQDARPDAPVLPSDPVLPPVQDARIDASALPQTGVNWLTAIGLALSGMTLMATGAFATLTGKKAKR